MKEKEKRELFSILLSAVSQVYLGDMGATEAILRMALEKMDEIRRSTPSAKEKEQ